MTEDHRAQIAALPDPAASSLLGGLSFSLGLFLVLVAGAELFTGNALMVIGRMRGRGCARQHLGSDAG